MNKKGFTLVELLAVIVILAIIALIVTPVVNNIITSARTSANARSVEGHIRNVELAIITEAFTKETGDLTVYDMTDGSIPSSIIDRIPNNDSVFCTKYTIENGTVLSASDCVSNINNWNKAYSYTNTLGAKVTGSNNINLTLTAAGSGDTYKGIVYMDPTDLTVECTSSSTLTDTNTGCKKFYVFNDDGNIYKMIMDRNLGGTTMWISKDAFKNAGGTDAEWGAYGNHSKGPITALNTLKNGATNWVGNPRMITADEIAHIVGADRTDTIKWKSSKPHRNTADNTNPSAYISGFYLDGSYSASPTTYSSTNGWFYKSATTQGSSHFAWLFDYTVNCNNSGCANPTSSTYLGYYTFTEIHDYISYIWVVDYEGILRPAKIADGGRGVRPVLELPKTLFNS